ncbi:IQ calmodulin-binding motif-containing [Brachionus plicatilis]|uniref:IQ calmodulin-binding motif-containing n=1 Tax=Brachionus plicatilis TaxID=10195 RepID=A0A3M7QIZ1_BRAPC|nr:IQ calmodulin-binding motif-containing [Brachionus plicatilis]
MRDKIEKTKILQKAYRSHLEKREKVRTKKMADDELRFQLMIKHRRRQRQRHIKLSNLIEILPANKIDKFMERQREDSAKIIQASWRGYRTRKNLVQTRQILIQNKAARKIQIAVRKWLERIKEKRQRPALYSRPKGLDSLKKEQLIDKIRKHINSLPPHPRHESQAQILHDKAQRMFQDYVIKQKSMRQQQYNLELLMVTAKNDAELLTNAPKFSDINEQDVDRFFTHKSKPIQLEAKYQHKRMHWKSKANWYELLEDESESDEEFDGTRLIDEKLEQINPLDPFHINNPYENKSGKGILKREKLKLKTNNIKHLTNNFPYLQKILDS